MNGRLRRPRSEEKMSIFLRPGWLPHAWLIGRSRILGNKYLPESFSKDPRSSQTQIREAHVIRPASHSAQMQAKEVPWPLIKMTTEAGQQMTRARKDRVRSARRGLYAAGISIMISIFCCDRRGQVGLDLSRLCAKSSGIFIHTSSVVGKARDCEGHLRPEL